MRSSVLISPLLTPPPVFRLQPCLLAVSQVRRCTRERLRLHLLRLPLVLGFLTFLCHNSTAQRAWKTAIKGRFNGQPESGRAQCSYGMHKQCKLCCCLSLRVIIKGTDEATALPPFAALTYMSGHLHWECHLKDSFNAPASAAPPSQAPGCRNLNVQILLFVSISFRVLPFKDTRSACFLKCSSA